MSSQRIIVNFCLLNLSAVELFNQNFLSAFKSLFSLLFLETDRPLVFVQKAGDVLITPKKIIK